MNRPEEEVSIDVWIRRQLLDPKNQLMGFLIAFFVILLLIVLLLSIP